MVKEIVVLDNIPIYYIKEIEIEDGIFLHVNVWKEKYERIWLQKGSHKVYFLPCASHEIYRSYMAALRLTRTYPA